MNKKIKEDTYELFDPLPNPGKSATVYPAGVLKNFEPLKVGDIVAIKEFNPELFNLEGQAKRTFLERYTGLKTETDRIVKNYDDFVDGQNHYLVMEYLDGKTLKELMKKTEEPDFETVYKLSHEILEGLFILHNNDPPIIHCDIKPANIMIVEGRGAVILDFGVIEHIKSDLLRRREFRGAVRYGAPEYIFDQNCNIKIDIFSFGIILYEIIFGKPYISPEIPYYQKIVLRAEPIHYPKFLTEKLWKKFGFKQALFIANVLEGTLCDFSCRLTSEQLHNAFKQRIWEQGYYNNIDLSKSQNWPEFPKEYNYLKENLNDLERNLSPIQIESMANFLYSYFLSEKEMEKDEELSLILYEHGLIKLPFDPIYIKENENNFNLSSFAWQFMITHFSYENLENFSGDLTELKSSLKKFKIEIHENIRNEQEVAAEEEYACLEKIAIDEFLADQEWREIFDYLPPIEHEKFKKVAKILGKEDN